MLSGVRPTGTPWWLLFCLAGLLARPGVADQSGPGRKVYDFYCYQCHGYAGDAKTLAASYLQTPPRDFSAADPVALDRQTMIDAVTNGRSGTAMAPFRDVIGAEQIEAVVDYVRARFLGNPRAEGRYHTAANGWPNHGRYAAAFPFVNGVVTLDMPESDLSPGQIAGRRLFVKSCISCHDQPTARPQEDVLTWQQVTVAQVGEEPEGLTGSERHGRQVYLDNCAFCHADDGTGRHWIGRFLEPNPRDLNNPLFAAVADRARVLDVILNGRPATSMPAWRDVLDARQVEDLMAWLYRRFGIGGEVEPVAVATPSLPAPVWQRQDVGKP